MGERDTRADQSGALSKRLINDVSHTGDSRFLDRVNYIVGELKVCQDAVISGYIGACPGAREIFEEEVSKGVIRSQGFDLNGLWAPFYTQQKYWPDCAMHTVYATILQPLRSLNTSPTGFITVVDESHPGSD